MLTLQCLTGKTDKKKNRRGWLILLQVDLFLYYSTIHSQTLQLLQDYSSYCCSTDFDGVEKIVWYGLVYISGISRL